MRGIIFRLFVCLFKLNLVLSQYLLLVLVSWLGSQYRRGFHTGVSWDHKALGENANAAISVSLQPCFVHCGDMLGAVSAYGKD